MVEIVIAWICVFLAIIDFNPQWAIAAAIFAIAGQMEHWRKSNG